MSQHICRFLCEGRAAPAGSKSAFAVRTLDGYAHRPDGRPIINVADKSKGLKEWARAVSIAAGVAMVGRSPFGGPIGVSIQFRVARPKWHVTRSGAVKPSAPAHPIVKPDVLKLARAVEDAMTGLVYADDAMIVDELLSKRYLRPGEKPGATITVWIITPSTEGIVDATTQFAIRT